MSKKKIELTELHWHEALDRTSIVMDMMARYLMEHPVYEQNKELGEKLNSAHQIIFDLYQEIGEIHLTG